MRASKPCIGSSLWRLWARARRRGGRKTTRRSTRTTSRFPRRSDRPPPPSRSLSVSLSLMILHQRPTSLKIHNNLLCFAILVTKPSATSPKFSPKPLPQQQCRNLCPCKLNEFLNLGSRISSSTKFAYLQQLKSQTATPLEPITIFVHFS